jgi:RHS repeat-associated protein
MGRSWMKTGLYYYGARYYDPRTSVWQSVDPLADKYPFVSPYNFCLNNPILFIDPDGTRVTIKDAASLKAILGGLTSDEIKRIKIKKDGVIKIRGAREGSRNLENLRTLVDSKGKPQR